MSLIDITTPRDAPICEKHHYKGSNCLQCNSEKKTNLRNLLREVVMRQQLAFPETEEDEYWFNEGLKDINESEKLSLMFKIGETLGLGKI